LVDDGARILLAETDKDTNEIKWGYMGEEDGGEDGNEGNVGDAGDKGVVGGRAGAGIKARGARDNKGELKQKQSSIHFTSEQVVELVKASEARQMALTTSGNTGTGNTFGDISGNNKKWHSPLELAVTGNSTIDLLEKNGILGDILLHVRIFARVSPENKAAIVRKFRSLGFIVGFCGDGGNGE
jgi:hypothetical protein